MVFAPGDTVLNVFVLCSPPRYRFDVFDAAIRWYSVDVFDFAPGGTLLDVFVFCPRWYRLWMSLIFAPRGPVSMSLMLPQGGTVLIGLMLPPAVPFRMSLIFAPGGTVLMSLMLPPVVQC